ncbi:MAG: helix-turn-helix domain-containing protein [Armatimonadetes bacterium]|nr:helix-turn-helix domain-containing protein [Armatimonadota bacterium]NIM23836.1 helix-turn-helix domain-containing protein [Armatimonadota bacterium]NIM67715.1 helix-turn-helix domain-containing protein [Armatimonadota bacterium]NIM76224.1 helix-turn-helix domain-containing protein [Armatimonadota bacterium]NIN05917.1 helix-turn-helix domain-containing protein [Armatimonadota bacterium]
MLKVNLGDRIRQARERLGLTQEELARRADTSQAAVSYIERRRWVKDEVLARYAAALEIPVASLLEGLTPPMEDRRERFIHSAFEVVCRDGDFGFGARGDESLSVETMLDIVRLYERYKGIHLLPKDFA